jgi:phosphoribosylanthranilate isomerase
MDRASRRRVWVKICGVTTVFDALFVRDAGADAIGLNFAPASPRRVTVRLAREIRSALGADFPLIGVFVNASLSELLATHRDAALDEIQLHGREPASLLDELKQRGLSSYKALRIAEEKDVALADSYPGEKILVDAKVKGIMGGSGQRFDWALVTELSRRRKMILAGGLTPENVADAVEQVLPFGVDTASGVESSPGVKDQGLVAEFVRRAKGN